MRVSSFAGQEAGKEKQVMPSQTTRSSPQELELIHALLDFSEDAVLVVDREGIVRFANSTAISVFRDRTAKLVGSNFGVPAVHQPVEIEVPSDESVRFMELRANEFKWHDEALTLAVLRDVTERKRMETELRSSEERYRRLFHDAVLGIFQTMPEGEIIDVNPAFANMFGYNSPDDMKRSVRHVGLELFLDPERRRSIIRQILATPGIHSFESVYKRRDGSQFLGKVHARPVRGHDGVLHHVEGFLEDITEMKKAEEAIRKSEERFSRVFSASPIGISISTISEGRFLDANLAFLSLYGYNREEVVGRTAAELNMWVDPEDRTRMVHQIRKSRKAQEFESEIRTKSDEIRTVLISAEVIEISGEEYILALVRDITEQKKAFEVRSRLASIVDSASDEIVATDLDGTITSWNSGAVKLFGYTEEEVLGRNISLIFPKEKENQERDILHRLRSGETITSIESARIKKDGTLVDVSLTISPIVDSKGNVIGISRIARDITDRKRVERELRLQHQRLERLIDSNLVGIVITKATTEVVEANDHFLNLVGFSRVEVKQRKLNWDSITPPEWKEADLKAIREVIATGRCVPYEKEYVRHDGTRVPVLLAYALMPGPENEVAIFVLDMTERKTLEEQLRQSQKLESLGTLAGGIAHDFNNILTIINGYTSVLRRTVVDDVQGSAYLDSVASATGRATGLVRQLLMFARKQDRILGYVEVNDVVKELLKLIKETFPKQITIEVSLCKDRTTIYGDHSEMHQLLLNLCVNARDAMMEQAEVRVAGGVLSIKTEAVMLDSVRERFPQATESEYVRLSVSDTGTGMDEATQRRIFEPFFTTKPEGKGTGLGLSTVYGIVKSHRGMIDVASKIGSGTTFTVCIPALIETKPSDEIAAEKGESVSGGNEKILVVEDEPALREYLIDLLRAEGYNVISADDGEKAVSTFVDNRDTKLVLSDVGLPKMGGIDVLETIKIISPKTHVILASGYLDQEERKRMEGKDVEAFIQKPYARKDLLLKIRTALNRS